jgi:rare lipoprotein A
MVRWISLVTLSGFLLVLSMGTVRPHREFPPTTRWSGLASWYGGSEPLNSHVAMGSRFDPAALEAAMWNVPFGTMVKVTNKDNKDNGRSIIVRVTDRGPARRFRDRVIDLTHGAFMTLAPLQQGLIPVTIQQVP